MIRLAKIGSLGSGLQKMTQDIDNATISTVEHTALFHAINELMPSNSSHLRKLGMFMIVSISYNMLLSRVQSSESSGVGR